MANIIEGRWDDLITRKDLRGRKVRVVVIEEGAGDEDPWLKSLRAWAGSHKRLGHVVDDSRDSIYPGTLSDPR